MDTKIIDSHRQLLDALIASFDSTADKTLLRLKEAGLTRQHIENNYDRLNQIKAKEKKSKISYIHAIRDFLQNTVHLHYWEAIDVISTMFEAKFLNPDNPYPYKKAVQVFLADRLVDIANARSEWRAYFEFRYLKPVSRYMSRHLKEHWLTINFNLFSFRGGQNMPPYRMHINVPDNLHPKYIDKKSPYDQREEDFESLAPFQGKYSTVWEIVSNNVSSIFYFDKTADHPNDMVIYEIDPDVSPGAGRVETEYVGRFYANGQHRPNPFLLQTMPGDENPEQIFEKERQRDENERKFQYSIVRFFIRSGIFNPEKAAYPIHLFEPDFKDLLKSAYWKFDKLKKGDLNLEKEIGLESLQYGQKLMVELGNVKYKDLKDILETQFASSKKTERRPRYDEARGKWLNFDDSDKYGSDEDEALNKVISLVDLIEPEALNIRLTIFEAGFFYLTQKSNTLSHIYWLPVIINWRQQFTGGVVFLNSDKRIDPAKEWEIDESGFYEDGSNVEPSPITPADKVPQDIVSILYYLTGLFTDKQIGEIEESIRDAAERAAAVSIMSRNISHNIGSHVLSYLKTLLSDESHMLKEGVLENLITVDADGVLHLSKDLEDESKLPKKDRMVLPYIRSVSRLLGYFQERQDYIGTFASDRYLYFSPLYFKESVVDHFYGTMRSISADGSKIKETRNLVLDYIVHSEGYRQSDIEVRVQWRDDDNAAPIPIGDKERRDKNGKLEVKSDIEIALPSGSTGRQGIYTILENFIRNSAKHGDAIEKRPDRKMVVTLTLSDANPDYYKLEVRDNSGNTTQGVVTIIQKVLTDPLIGPDGSPDERHKGIKEIQIAAGWLRGIRPHDLLNKPFLGGLPVLKVTQVPDEKGEGSLQYTFYLRKPKPGLLVVPDRSKYFEKDAKGRITTELKNLFRESLKYWTIQEYGDPRLLNPDKTPYRFVVTHRDMESSTPEEWKETYLEIYKRSPARVLTGWTDVQLQSEHLDEDLYRAWLDGDLIYFGKKPSVSRFGLVLPNDKKSASISESITIGIEDASPVHSFSDEALPQLVVDRPIEDARKQNILFREHNDQIVRFDRFRKEKEVSLDNYLFLEGISGDNSTNRLLRHEVITPMWRYKILEAALTKIIVIDERLWKNYYSDDIEEREINHLRWEKKNIHILSFEFDPEHPGYLCLKNLRGQIVAKVDNMGDPSFTKPEYETAYRESHFVSLHQGLLERTVKHCAEGLVGMTEQEQVDVLFKKFRDQLLLARFRVIIHSGRSKTHVLPYPTAFVQLSALGSSMRDSKLTLCELFYSTIQEANTEQR